MCQNEEEVKGNTLAGSFAFRSGLHLNFWWRTLDQANQGIDGIIIAFFGKRGTKSNMNINPISSLISSCLFCSLFYFPVPRASFPYSPFPVLVILFHSRDQHLCKFGTRHLHNKKFSSHRNWWGHVHGGLFVVKFRRRHVHFRFIKSNSSENVRQQGQNASKLAVSYTELCKFCLLTCLRLIAFRQLAI